ncbi:biotin/lipoyl-containing protein, partial [Staphylococcus haemolyticus]|uniref:biotin/lipoyl-containing protein n=1 Tax=Staphylococcus haemolyticus TaxID=1283 RepID=UPI0028CBB61F
MRENIIMGKVGMRMKEGRVEEWFKGEGDVVEEGESICRISCEKLSEEVEGGGSGRLVEIKVEEG